MTTRTNIARSAPRWALRALWLAAAAVFLLLAIGPRTGLYRTATVLSGSMRPAFAPGDLVVLRPEPIEDVRAGQVITYAIPVGDHHVESHRIVRVLKGGRNPVVQTKGDANDARDPWTAVLHGRQAWRVAAVVPGAGRVVLWLRQPWVRMLSILVAPALLVLLGLARIWGREPVPPAQPAQHAPRLAPAPVDERLAA